ncbi:uL22 family ribosomal protein [Candidatus Carsonella ruddii]|uniref:50S ribosomal protein L22 n=1 Tax=Candidatus Carsonella ruddii (Diaphorina cf. continua) TaxID=2661587 RepID=A0A7R6W0J1_CARRU|nr:uL22 family ribosomal protein [Candidatus Carsonella ruddii (Diaphorina cf. continua)]BCG49390.1 50S ribosomal protein L22 [Candidatus Carsonella ruddii (Diaphorina cf. continua)]
MLSNFKFKNIPLSFRKIYCYSKKLSNKPILYYFKNNFVNKINFYIKKIASSIINSCKSTNIFINNFYVGKSKIIKKINFRAKGKVNFIVKRYSNISINILYG